MAKLYSMLILIVAIEVTMKLFLGITTPATSLIDMVLNLSTLNLSSLFLDTTNWFGLAAVGGIVIGSIWGSKGDFLVFASIAALFWTYAKIFSQLHTTLVSVIDAHTVMHAGALISFFIITPMVILYLYTILKFWRGND